ncbi:Uncharacterised protein [Plesiomonas shigelloides]|uniref:helix-turn-helix domain-containing protein n=1 Tax=Plesiomonas shigelloides TaxID=703 RepID=UPI000E07D4C1|nr:helix-turn-helix domain-containing protein [Plesiomonas shigelloides]SUB63223.1 Uncharacterised protein [Plesiomonas shigelloides]
MSRIATDWAWRLDLAASQKLLMLALADRADECHCCYPSVERLVKDTGLDRKTIGKWINHMIDSGLIEDTGERKGPTKRVRVLRLNIGTECTQKRNDSKIGNIPKIGTLNDPKIGILNDPKFGIQNQSLEPVIEPRSFTSENESSDTHGGCVSLPADGKAIQSGTKWGTADDLAAAEWMFGQVLAIAPKAKKPNYAVWANEIRLMRERDGKQHREICELFKWACQDSFWSGNILSPAALRRKWDQLEINRNKQASGRQAGKPTINNTDWLTLDDLMGDRL